MGRPKGSKNKSVKEKVEEVMETVAVQYERETDPVVKEELAEAVEELSEVLNPPVEPSTDLPPKTETTPPAPSIETPKTETKKVKGHHPVTKEPVYLKV